MKLRFFVVFSQNVTYTSSLIANTSASRRLSFSPKNASTSSRDPRKVGPSCRVVSCRVVSCYVASSLVSPCLVSSYLVLSCLVLSCLVLSCLVSSCLVLSQLFGFPVTKTTSRPSSSVRVCRRCAVSESDDITPPSSYQGYLLLFMMCRILSSHEDHFRIAGCGYTGCGYTGCGYTGCGYTIRFSPSTALKTQGGSGRSI
jgi:hypothetical protein